MIHRSGLIFLTAMLFLSFLGFTFAEEKKEEAAKKPAAPKKAPKPKEFPDFKDIVTDEYKKIEGYYIIYRHQEKEKAYIEIPAGTMGQDFLLATTIEAGSTYAGWQWGDSLLYWKRYGKQLALLERQLQYRAGNPSSPLGTSVARTYKDTLVTTYNIVTLNGGNPVLDLNSLTVGSVSIFFGYWFRVGDQSLAKFTEIKSFEQNTEISIEFPDPYGDFITLHYSFRNLPASDFKSRVADDRIGYFLTAYKDLTDGKSEEGNFIRFVNRWNLKKQDPKLDKSPVVKPIIFYIEKTVPIKLRHAVREGIEEWNRAFEKVGFLNAIVVRQQTSTNEFKDLDPADSRYNFFRWIASGTPFAMGPSRVDPRTGEILDADIVFDSSYIDFSLMEYDQMIKEGAEKSLSPYHQKYLEKNPHRHPMAQFMHSSHKKEDETLHKTDQLISKAIANKETKLSHRICMIGHGKSHEFNIASLYFRNFNRRKEEGPKGGATTPKEDPYPQDFINQVVKDIVMHEVGHTLGLRHNFKASSWRSLKEINSKEKPGALTASVMDYNPTNLKGAEKDAIQGNFQMTTLGPYDYWAINYGYTPSEDAKELAKIASQSAKPEHVYGTDEDVGSPDPFIQRWDLGDDPIAFAQHRLGIAESMMKDVMKRSLKKGDGYNKLTATFGMLLYEYYRAGSTSLSYLGGEEVNRHHYGDENGKDPIVLIAPEKQRKALAFVCEKLFAADTFKFSPEMLTKLGPSQWTHWGSSWNKEHTYDVYSRILKIQSWLLYEIINGEIFNRVQNAELKSKDKNFVTIPEIFTSVRQAVWSELTAKAAKTPTNRHPLINGYRRNLQRVHLKELIDLAMEDSYGWNPVAARTIAWLELKTLKAEIDKAIATHSLDQDLYTKSHLAESSTRIQKAMEAAYTLNPKSSGFGGGFIIIIGEEPQAKDKNRK